MIDKYDVDVLLRESERSQRFDEFFTHHLEVVHVIFLRFHDLIHTVVPCTLLKNYKNN